MDTRLVSAPSLRPLAAIAYSCALLGILASGTILGFGVLFFALETYSFLVKVVTAVMVIIGGLVIIFNAVVLVKTVRSWSWKNLAMIGLTLANIGIESIFVFLFCFFSKPLAGTGT